VLSILDIDLPHTLACGQAAIERLSEVISEFFAGAVTYHIDHRHSDLGYSVFAIGGQKLEFNMSRD
jgi:hypothetical protein